MSRKKARSGGKYGGKHTAVIPAAIIVCDIANKCSSVTKIAPGFIKAGLRPVGSHQVKITPNGGSALFSVRGGTSHQELRVYGKNIQAAIETITNDLRKENFIVTVASE